MSLSVFKMSLMIEVIVYLTVISILPYEHDTDTQARAHFKYITNVNIVGANVSVGAAGHVGVNDTSQAKVAAVQLFLRV